MCSEVGGSYPNLPKEVAPDAVSFKKSKSPQLAKPTNHWLLRITLKCPLLRLVLWFLSPKCTIGHLIQIPVP